MSTLYTFNQQSPHRPNPPHYAFPHILTFPARNFYCAHHYPTVTTFHLSISRSLLDLFLHGRSPISATPQGYTPPLPYHRLYRRQLHFPTRIIQNIPNLHITTMAFTHPKTHLKMDKYRPLPLHWPTSSFITFILYHNTHLVITTYTLVQPLPQ